MVPVSAGHTPNNDSATSVRPEPTRPAKPSTSPSRTSKFTSCERTATPEPFDAEGDLAGSVSGAVEEVGELAADHVADQRHLGDVGVGVRGDVLAVAEHGDPVAELEHLVEAMADEQHGDARLR